MSSILSSVTDFLRDNDVRFDRMPDDPELRAGFAGENGTFTTYVTFEEEDRALSLRTVCPVVAQNGRRPEVIEVITWANAMVRLGNFEMSMATGYMAFKTSVIFGEKALTRGLSSISCSQTGRLPIDSSPRSVPFFSATSRQRKLSRWSKRAKIPPAANRMQPRHPRKGRPLPAPAGEEGLATRWGLQSTDYPRAYQGRHGLAWKLQKPAHLAPRSDERRRKDNDTTRRFPV